MLFLLSKAEKKKAKIQFSHSGSSYRIGEKSCSRSTVVCVCILMRIGGPSGAQRKTCRHNNVLLNIVGVSERTVKHDETT